MKRKPDIHHYDQTNDLGRCLKISEWIFHPSRLRTSPSCLKPFDPDSAAAGEALVDLAVTGSPLFNGVWTALHSPVVTLPVLEGPNGLPLGLRLIGILYQDAALLDAAGTVFAALA